MATYTVSTTANTGAGSLRAAITAANADPGSTIVFDSALGVNAKITLASALPAITANMTIDGSDVLGLTISGNNVTRVFFVQSGNVAIENLNIADGYAKGGDGGDPGGGGGLGAGGAIFVNAGTTTIENVTFTNNNAKGGDGGAVSTAVVQGGAVSGTSGGGGGGGLNADGGWAPGFNGGNGGGPNGGTGGPAYSGGGSASGDFSGGGGAGGGGDVNGGNGGFGGGGGGSGSSAYGTDGGNGGFGGGGGGSAMGAAYGGFGGGAGAPGLNPLAATGAGGGGAAFGGALFVRSGANIVIKDGLLDDSGISGGAGGGTGATGGLGLGSDIFLHSGSTATFAPDEGKTLIFNGTIRDDGSVNIPPSMVNSAGAGASVTIGDGTSTGTVVMGYGGTGYYFDTTAWSAGTIFKSGTLELAGVTFGAITFQTGAQTLVLDNDALQFSATYGNNALFRNLVSFGAGDTIDLKELSYAAGAQASFASGILTVTSGANTVTLQMANPFSTGFLVRDDGAGGTLVYLNAPPVLTGDLTATIIEGSSYTPQPSDLGFVDPDDDAANVVFTVTDLTNLRIWVNYSSRTTFTAAELAAGLVEFSHDGSETTTASFKVSVEDGNEDGSTPVAQTFTFNVTPWDDIPRQNGDRRADIAEGSAYTIQTSDLYVQDDDDDISALLFEAINVTYGTLLVDGVEADTFTAAQIAAGKVVFQHDGSERSRVSFSVHLADFEGHASPYLFFDVYISPVNDAPAFGGDNAITVAEGGSVLVTTADLTATDPDNANAQLVYTVTATAHGSVLLNGSAATTFTQDDIANSRVTFLHDGGEADGSFTVSLSDGAASGGSATVTATVDPHANDAPAAGNVTLSSIQVNSGARIITQAQLLANSFDIDSTLTVTDLHIASGQGALLDNGNGTWTYTPKTNDDTQVNFVFTVSDGQFSSDAEAKLDITSAQSAPELGSPGDDTFTAVTGNGAYHGLGGIDTINLGFKLTEATVTYSGNQVIIDGPASHTVLTGFEKFVFTDGTVDNNDGNWLVDDLFYYASRHDLWNAHIDAEAHFNQSGWKEGRDPNAFFDTAMYLALNPDVKAAGINPLTHFDTVGWKEGRLPSTTFDATAYLAANPDVKAAGVDPLAHFLQFGAQEGRQPFAVSELFAPNGFDYAYYLANNPDVAAAGIDAFQHFQTVGWKERRDPNALFDTEGYLATYGDVKNAGINPLDHYHANGWKEGRDPSPNFDSSSYLAAYADVKAAGIDPLLHYLDHGRHEGRSAFADGVWG